MERRDLEKKALDPIKIEEQIGPYKFTMELGVTRAATYHVEVTRPIVVDGKVTNNLETVGDVVSREVYLDVLATLRTRALDKLSDSLDPFADDGLIPALDKISEELNAGIDDTFAAQVINAIKLSAD